MDATRDLIIPLLDRFKLTSLSQYPVRGPAGLSNWPCVVSDVLSSANAGGPVLYVPTST